MLTEGNSLKSTSYKDNFKDEIYKILFEVNKPSRYIGQEIGSSNKNWNSAIIKTAIAFPDMYEIGISNLGHRILYHLINNYEKGNFLADRVYAPAPDFKKKLAENQIPLYGAESFKPLKEFDIIAFSLQYELSYPTILSMLEMGLIPVKNSDRSETDPIVIAGGPGSYNPEPLTDFIDVFIIGDGEEVLIEILEEIEDSKSKNLSRTEILKNLAKIDGIYVSRFYKQESGMPYPVSPEFPDKINKRISKLTDKSYPVDFPVPYSPSVHDRAVIEIRRGCGRMCRFCQSCFVNLPVREREPESIIDITDKTLRNTGYEEYSLLSLSSSDYSNIEELVCALNNRHASSGASISLPSQRADAFSLELANLVQSVRKSTLTFAPEAGSQRLRNAINKNLREEQILNAVITSYKAGWNKIKLYFMIGLPTETYEDLDEIINLLKTIKNKAFEVKSELDIKKHLDITCTISIFVPKPFTPFQWCPQDRIEVIEEKIRYLKDKVRPLRGVKLNFHDSFLSQLEAVFARGDRKLNRLIELAWQKGSYLDAWNDHFNKEIWHQSAQELDIDFNSYSSKKFSLESELTWDIINTGIDKNWLIQEFENSVQSEVTIPCDERCNNCGVCKNLSTAPNIKSGNTCKSTLHINDDLSENNGSQIREEIQTYKYRLKIQKTGCLKYISHLDWQSLIYKSIRKAGIKISFSKGFNPAPKISVGLALPLFVESCSEFVDIEIEQDMKEQVLLDRMNEFLPENSKILKIVKISKDAQSIDRAVSWAKYSALPVDLSVQKKIDLEYVVKDFLARENVFTEKQDKKGFKKLIDIRPFVHSVELNQNESFCKLEFILMTGVGYRGNSTPGSLRADKFLQVLTPNVLWNITREKLFDSDFKELV